MTKVVSKISASGTIRVIDGQSFSLKKHINGESNGAVFVIETPLPTTVFIGYNWVFRTERAVAPMTDHRGSSSGYPSQNDQTVVHAGLLEPRTTSTGSRQ
jgi:hypothetical protein